MPNSPGGLLSIAFLSPGLSRGAGGIFEVTRRLAQSLVQLPDVNVEIFGVTDDDFQQDVASWAPIAVHAYPSYGPRQFAWSPRLARAFGESTADVAHLHALWMHTSIMVRGWSRRRQKPYVTTLHGMLDAWSLGNSGLKKRVCSWAYEKSCLDCAACLHAFTAAELASVRDFGLKNQVCVIPNGVDLPEPVMRPAPWNGALAPGKKALLYLGRLHPKKGLMHLLTAWRSLQRQNPSAASDWSLVIAGWDQGGHEMELKTRAVEMGVDRDVVFTGPVFGDAKDAAYAHADAFVLPSHSEGLPMTVLEAWAHGKPVLMTPQCNLGEGTAAGAAVEAQPEPESLREGLADLLGASDGERAAMGARGLELVQRKFTWPQVAADMHEVYRWLVGGGPAPACVVKA